MVYIDSKIAMNPNPEEPPYMLNTTGAGAVKDLDYVTERRLRMRIPDAQLFPRENAEVLVWLHDPKNAAKDLISDFSSSIVVGHPNIMEHSPWHSKFGFGCPGYKVP